MFFLVNFILYSALDCLLLIFFILRYGTVWLVGYVMVMVGMVRRGCRGRCCRCTTSCVVGSSSVSTSRRKESSYQTHLNMIQHTKLLVCVEWSPILWVMISRKMYTASKSQTHIRGGDLTTTKRRNKKISKLGFKNVLVCCFYKQLTFDINVFMGYR